MAHRFADEAQHAIEGALAQRQQAEFGAPPSQQQSTAQAVANADAAVRDVAAMREPAAAALGSERPRATAEERGETAPAEAPVTMQRLDNARAALGGTLVPEGFFGGITGIAESRQAQFDAFSNGDVASIEGSGMGAGNLRRLQEMAPEAARYGITITVEGDHFRIENANYVPAFSVSEEDRLALGGALDAARGYAEAGDFQRASEVYRQYEAYMQGARYLEGLERTMFDARDDVARGPVGGSERVARDLIEVATGGQAWVTDETLPAEFERITGVAYEDFIVRQEGRGFAGTGLGGIALERYERAIEAAGAAQAVLRDSVQAAAEGREFDASMADAGFARAASLAAVGDSIMADVERIRGARQGAERARSVIDDQGVIDVANLASVAGSMGIEVGASITNAPERHTVAVADVEDRRDGLIRQRDAAVRSYTAAESNAMEAAHLWGIQAESEEQAADNARRAQEAEGDSDAVAARAEGEIGGLVREAVRITTEVMDSTVRIEAVNRQYAAKDEERKREEGNVDAAIQANNPEEVLAALGRAEAIVREELELLASMRREATIVPEGASMAEAIGRQIAFLEQRLERYESAREQAQLVQARAGLYQLAAERTVAGTESMLEKRAERAIDAAHAFVVGGGVYSEEEVAVLRAREAAGFVPDSQLSSTERLAAEDARGLYLSTGDINFSPSVRAGEGLQLMKTAVHETNHWASVGLRTHYGGQMSEEDRRALADEWNPRFFDEGMTERSALSQLDGAGLQIPESMQSYFTEREIVEIFMEGIDATSEEGRGETVLHQAYVTGDWRIVRTEVDRAFGEGTYDHMVELDGNRESIPATTAPGAPVVPEAIPVEESTEGRIAGVDVAYRYLMQRDEERRRGGSQ